MAQQIVEGHAITVETPLPSCAARILPHHPDHHALDDQ